jgi:hypothetical protein
MGGVAVVLVDTIGMGEEATVADQAAAGAVSGDLLPPDDGAQLSAVVAGEVEAESAAEIVEGMSAAQLERLREVLVAAHPDAVPELIAGATFEALLDSVDGARAAFTRVRDESARVLAAGVPRGGGTREIDPAVFAGLSPEGKIAVGLSRK